MNQNPEEINQMSDDELVAYFQNKARTAETGPAMPLTEVPPLPDDISTENAIIIHFSNKNAKGIFTLIQVWDTITSAQPEIMLEIGAALYGSNIHKGIAMFEAKHKVEQAALKRKMDFSGLDGAMDFVKNFFGHAEEGGQP